ncbi:MAG: class I poly(R)-hydroxyalkanoic acid synthase, partial [Casimicrobiaceae bacterium]
KYGCWTNTAERASADAWRESAQHREGAWWSDWRQWIERDLGREVPARVPGKGRLPVIEAAPGSFARLRADAE